MVDVSGGPLSSGASAPARVADEVRLHGVRVRWVPAWSAVLMDFEPGCRLGREEARACIIRMQAWAGDGPYRVLIDTRNVEDADYDWRVAFSRLFRSQRGRVRVAWFGLRPFLRVMVRMFIHATGIDGGAFDTEDEARAFLGLPPGGAA